MRLERLVVDERVNVRTDALERLVALAPDMAAAAARDGLYDQSPHVRAASIRVLGAAGSASDLARIAACIERRRCRGQGRGRVRREPHGRRCRPRAGRGRDRTPRRLRRRRRPQCRGAHAGRLRAGQCDRSNGAAPRCSPTLTTTWSMPRSRRFIGPKTRTCSPCLSRHLDGPRTAGAAVDALVRVGERRARHRRRGLTQRRARSSHAGAARARRSRDRRPGSGRAVAPACRTHRSGGRARRDARARGVGSIGHGPR